MIHLPIGFTPESTASPAKTRGTGINGAIVEKNARLSLKLDDWKSSSESRAYNNSVSQAEEMQEGPIGEERRVDVNPAIQNNTQGTFFSQYFGE